ncbi:MAG: xanthine dehydrogenase family protein subunit M [Candidatus Bathyarchaeota archaeon]|nr:MAG: xanthine dehydrogenase family protein subunit M [Candidatus Bathyarchaeota archaeon]
MQINRVDTHILPVRFEYHAPKSLEEALGLLSLYRGEARLLAGGTDLLVQMKQKLVEPGHLVNLKRIPELSEIRAQEGGVSIGAAVKLRQIERSEIVGNSLPLLLEAVRSMASVQIRNMATLGGNLCNASPAADTAVALISLDSAAEIAGPTGKRTTPIVDFFVGPGETVLGDDEMLTGVLVPYPEAGYGFSFMKIGRTRLDIATVNTAVVVKLEGEEITEARVSLGAVAPIPLNLGGVERFLIGKQATPEVFLEAAEMCCDYIEPISDVRASAEYRIAATKALIQDALSIACGRARRV